MTASSALPALLGGPPVRPQGPPDWPLPDEEVHQALESAWRDGNWGKYHGPHVERLCQQLAEYHAVDFALACGSGTFAVELALRALQVGPGDEVVLSAYDYGGNFLNVHALGAVPVLVDIDPATWQMDVRQLRAAIGPTTRAVIVSHLHGGLVPMDEVMTVAREHQVAVIEDAAQAPGARVAGRMCGTWGDVGVLSFGGSKLLSAGRGGAIVTQRADIHQRAKLWQQRGNVVNPLSELQAAVLISQLARLEERNAVRGRNVQRLLGQLPIIPSIRPFTLSCSAGAPGYYKLGLQYDQAAFGLPREKVVQAMQAEGIALDEGFRALHMGRSPKRFRAAGELQQAVQAHRGCLVLHHPVLLGSDEDIDQIVRAFAKIHAHADRLSEAAASG